MCFFSRFFNRASAPQPPAPRPDPNLQKPWIQDLIQDVCNKRVALESLEKVMEGIKEEIEVEKRRMDRSLSLSCGGFELAQGADL